MVNWVELICFLADLMLVIMSSACYHFSFCIQFYLPGDGFSGFLFSNLNHHIMHFFDLGILRNLSFWLRDAVR